MRGAEAFRKHIREDVERGSDLIKVCVSGWLEDAFREPRKYEISNEELGAAIEEAHRLDRRVAVHALSEAGVETAVAMADLVGARRIHSAWNHRTNEGGRHLSAHDAVVATEGRTLREPSLVSS